MITKTLVKSVYHVCDTKTKMYLTIEYTSDKLALFTERGDKEFVFSTANTPKTKEKWRNVAKLITKACDLV